MREHHTENKTVFVEIVTKEFLALMEAGKDAANKCIENLLAEFGVLRSAVIRRIEGPKTLTAKLGAKYGYVADVCVTGLNEKIDEIERWRSSEIVGFSASRLRAEAREAELNQAIVELSREDFLMGNSI